VGVIFRQFKFTLPFIPSHQGRGEPIIMAGRSKPRPYILLKKANYLNSSFPRRRESMNIKLSKEQKYWIPTFVGMNFFQFIDSEIAAPRSQ